MTEEKSSSSQEKKKEMFSNRVFFSEYSFFKTIYISFIEEFTRTPKRFILYYHYIFDM